MALPINIEEMLNKRKVESNRIEFKKPSQEREQEIIARIHELGKEMVAA